MTAKEYRMRWKAFVWTFDYEHYLAEMQAGYMVIRDLYPNGIGRLLLEAVRVIGFIKLQWYRLLNWAFYL